MKYFLSCTVLLLLAVAVQVTAQDTQKPVYKLLDLDPSYRVTAVSPNGKYILGIGIESQLACFYNVETGDSTFLDEEGQEGIRTYKVTDSGVVVGAYGENNVSNKPALWKDGSWEFLPLPKNAKSGTANSISNDNKIIVGFVDLMPCYWVLNNGKYEFNDLPCVKKDWNGQKPQWIVAYDVAADGSAIYGAIRDMRGLVPLPTAWIRNSEGKYDSMITLCMDISLNREFLPGPQVMPEYEDYVTAEKGTPEFDEQMAKWNEVWTTYEEEYGKCVKGVTINAQSGSISSDGKYITLSCKKPYQDPINPEIRSIDVPLRVEIATDRTETYGLMVSEDGMGMGVLGNLTDKEGNLFATVQDGFFVSTTFVYPAGETEPIELYNWLKEKYNLDISEDLTYYMDYLDKDSVLTGRIAMSSSGNMIVGSSGNPTGGKFTTYSIKLFDTTGINESAVAPAAVTLYAKDGTLYLNGKANEIALSDMSGKVVLSSRVDGNKVNVGQLQKGIYIVELNTDSGRQYHKIILN